MRNVGPGYTKIAIMAGEVCTAGGELLNDAKHKRPAKCDLVGYGNLMCVG